VCGAFAGALKKKLGLVVTSEKVRESGGCTGFWSKRCRRRGYEPRREVGPAAPASCGAPRRLPVGSRHETELVFVVVGCSLDRAIDAVEQTPCYSRAKPA